MTRQAREAVSLAIATALGELAIQGLMVPDWSDPGRDALRLAFLAGPPLFLALLAWRRRESVRRSRVLFAVAVLVAVGGLGALGFNLYRFSTDAAFRRSPDASSVVIPLVQWVAVAAVWLWLVALESSEKRAAGQAGQPGPSPGAASRPNPPQSP